MSVQWKLNGDEIPAYLEVSTSKIGKRINVLSIESVKADHRGNYSCVAENQAGVAEFTAPLVVIGSCNLETNHISNSVFVFILIVVDVLC